MKPELTETLQSAAAVYLQILVLEKLQALKYEPHSD